MRTAQHIATGRTVCKFCGGQVRKFWECLRREDGGAPWKESDGRCGWKQQTRRLLSIQGGSDDCFNYPRA